MKSDSPQNQKRQGRRAYKSPTLVVYGDVRQLTAAGTSVTTEDSAGMAMSTAKP